MSDTKIDQIEAVCRALSGDVGGELSIVTLAPEEIMASGRLYTVEGHRWRAVAVLRREDGSALPLSEMDAIIDTPAGPHRAKDRPTWGARIDALHAVAMERVAQAERNLASAKAVRP